jgi:predicted nucleotidyltransferase
MKYAEKIKSRLEKHLPDLRSRYPVSRLALFGSVLRDDFDPEKSDIDILVELNGDMDWNYFDLCFEIQSLFPDYKVDVVSRGAIQDHYWPSIEEDLTYVEA